MKIRMTVQQPDGARLNGQPWPKRGDVVDLPTAQAAHLVAAAVAEAVDEGQDDGAATSPPDGKPPRGRRAAAARREG